MIHDQAFVRRALLLLFLGVSALIFGGCQSIDDKWVDDRVVSPAEVSEEIHKSPSDYLLIDARGAKEYAKEHIPNARRMDPWDIDARNPDPKLADYKALVVYSNNRGSGDARALAKHLGQASYKNVTYMAEGLEGWKAAGYVVDSQLPPAPGGSTPASRSGNPMKAPVSTGSKPKP